MSAGKWLSADKRAAIIDGNAKGLTHRAIAKAAKVSASTVYKQIAAYARDCRLKEKRPSRAVEMAGEIARAVIDLQHEVRDLATR
jgi:transposase